MRLIRLPAPFNPSAPTPVHRRLAKPAKRATIQRRFRGDARQSAPSAVVDRLVWDIELALIVVPRPDRPLNWAPVTLDPSRSACHRTCLVPKRRWRRRVGGDPASVAMTRSRWRNSDTSARRASLVTRRSSNRSSSLVNLRTAGGITALGIITGGLPRCAAAGAAARASSGDDATRGATRLEWPGHV